MNESLTGKRIIVTGATGLVGSALVEHLEKLGAETIRGVRRPSTSPGQMYWNPEAGEIESGKLDGAAGVIHLAGENIAAKRWTPAFKARLRDSRVDGTKLIAEAIAHAANKPQTFICASAIGYYGDRGDEVLTETTAAGSDFLADVCRQWEAACEPARRAGVRTVNARIGVVFTPAGGILKKLLPPFRLGVGGVQGDGRQYISWISLADVVNALTFILTHTGLEGPVNVTAPAPVTNRQLAKMLGGVLSRPTFFPMPAPVVRLMFGEMGDALMLASTRVSPQRLLDEGFHFEHPELESALRRMIG